MIKAKPKANTKTRPGDPKTKVVAEPFKYIVIVGTENYHNNPANKAMFMHAALHQLKSYPDTADSKKVVLFFPADYSSELQNAFKAACLKTGVTKKNFKSIDTKEDLIAYINDRKYRQIKQVDIFSHGTIGALLFGLNTMLDANMNMAAEHVQQLKADKFSITATITSYACQTANGKGKTKKERLNNSLARALSNATKTEVRAYMRKTTYEGVLGDAAMRQDYYEYINSPKKWKDPADAWELTEEERARGKIIVNSETRRNKSAEALGDDKTIFDPAGALLPVKADTVPEDVPANLFIFYPPGKNPAGK